MHILPKSRLSLPFFRGGGGDEVVYGLKMARAMSWVAGVLIDVSKAKAKVVPVEVNKALAIVTDVGASLPFPYTIPTFVSAEAKAMVASVGANEVLAILADVRASNSFTNTILA